MKPASRYKKWLEGWCGVWFGRIYLARWGSTLAGYVFTETYNYMAVTVSGYKKRLAATLRGGFTPASINDAEIRPPYVFTPWVECITEFEFNLLR